MKRIPLPNGKTHFKFTVEIESTVLHFRVDWLTRYEYFIVSIEAPDKGTKVSGRGLHPEIDLLRGLQLTDMDSLYIKGKPPTPDNLNRTSHLVYGEL